VTENVPQVVGKSSELMKELIDGLGKAIDILYGNEKFCKIRNLLGLAGFGIIENGEDWKGPMMDSRSAREKGPM
jgi:hypothetical protein